MPKPLAGVAAAAAAYIDATVPPAGAAAAGGSGSGGGGDAGDGATAHDDAAAGMGLAWTKDALAYLFETVQADMKAGRKPDYCEMLTRLGWGCGPDAARALLKLRNKYCAMRHVVEAGATYEERIMPKARYPYPLVRRVREAVLSLPQRQATAKEVCAVIAADPHYSPHLDRRPLTTDATRVERWQKQVTRILSCRELYGFINTGARRDGRAVYQYDAGQDLRLDPPLLDLRTRAREGGGAEAAATAAGPAGVRVPAQPTAAPTMAERSSGDRGEPSGAVQAGQRPTSAPLQAGNASPRGRGGRGGGGGGGGEGGAGAKASGGPKRGPGPKLAAQQHDFIEAAAIAALEALERGQEVVESEIAAAAAGRGLPGL